MAHGKGASAPFIIERTPQNVKFSFLVFFLKSAPVPLTTRSDFPIMNESRSEQKQRIGENDHGNGKDRHRFQQRHHAGRGGKTGNFRHPHAVCHRWRAVFRGHRPHAGTVLRASCTGCVRFHLAALDGERHGSVGTPSQRWMRRGAYPHVERPFRELPHGTAACQGV